MKAILKATGERGEAYIDEGDGWWHFQSLHGAETDRRVKRSEIVILENLGATLDYFDSLKEGR